MNNTTWAIESAHSELQFKVKHLMISNVTGSFGSFEGSVNSADADFNNAEIAFTARIDSINTGSPDRDKHLQSPDFFDAEKFPEIKFQSTSFTKTSDDEYSLIGELTMHGVTKSVSLTAEAGGTATDPYGQHKAGFSLSGKLNREDFGLTWNAALETGGVLVSKDVRILAEIQLVKQA